MGFDPYEYCERKILKTYTGKCRVGVRVGKRTEVERASESEAKPGSYLYYHHKDEEIGPRLGTFGE